MKQRKQFAAAKYLHKVVNQPNIYIKIPGTTECVPTVKQVISLGISMNVTLIFSLWRYETIIDAYLEGLEAAQNTDLSKIASVASFFVSRLDSLLTNGLKKLEQESK
ncbi:hypothetical protein L7F22_016712 [Adiantum nelumboides]|nr:hypothetical protein [Adiantum nelumboides]